MPHTREENYNGYPELDLSLKLSQIENALKFLDYVNNEKKEDGSDFSRNTTERQTIKRNLERVQECKDIFKDILNKHKNNQNKQQVDIFKLAREQFLHDS